MIFNFRRGLAYVAVAFFIFNLTACRFKVPNAAEGQHMVDNGVFSEKVPSWVMQSKDKPLQPVANAGVAAQTQSVPRAVVSTAMTVPQAASDSLNQEQRMRQPSNAAEDEKNKKLGAAPELAPEPAKEVSPLDRIEQSCNGSESAVKDALQTLDRQARIGKYEKLSRRCPQSSDIWLWLAKDYESSNKLAEANRCFEKVLMIDPGNQEALGGLTSVKQKLNDKPAVK